jgi:hypothetical protein
MGKKNLPQIRQISKDFYKKIQIMQFL